MICPKCNSVDVRLSRNAPWFHIVYAWHGRERYRCRECQRSFYAAIPLEDRSKLEQTQELRLKRLRRRRRAHGGRARRRMMAISIFLVVFLAFYCAFSCMYKDSGVLNRPVAKTQR
jgi:hypothetical protein